MGVAFYIELDRKVEFNEHVEGKPLAWVFEELEAFCNEHKLKGISDYVYQDMSEFLEDFDESLIPEQTAKWFDAQEGIDWVSGLIEKLKEEKPSFCTEDTITILEDFLQVFKDSKEADAQWHLALDA